MGDEAILASLRRALAAAHRERALVYLKTFERLARRLGEAEAATLMREAIRERGREIGRSMRRSETAAFLEAFAGESAEAPLWEMEVARSGEVATIRMGRCPLKDAWLAAGLPEERVATLCHIASALDEGTFEAAGFRYEIATWRPGTAGCCRIAIRPA